jgi:hypothetical protein
MFIIFVCVWMPLFFIVPALAELFAGIPKLTLRVLCIAFEVLGGTISITAGLACGFVVPVCRIPIAGKGEACDQNHEANVRFAHGTVL